MADTTPQSDQTARFLRHLLRSQLVNQDELKQLITEYQGDESAPEDKADTESLARWLVRREVLTRYQASALLKGHGGPFVFGDYRVVDRIKNGRFQRTFVAVHVPTRQVVLLRFFKPDFVNDEARMDSMRALSSTLQTMSSPRLQGWYEFVESEGYCFVVQERLKGESLRERLDRDEPLDSETACRIVRQIAEALVALRPCRRAHGDICPHNVWLDEHGCVRLLVEPSEWTSPLSLAAASALDERRLDYLAPELAIAGSVLSESSDLYALGCTLYESLTGRPPFGNVPPSSKLQAHVSQPIQVPDGAEVPAGVESLLLSMVSQKPESRFQRAEDVIGAVNELVRTSDPAPLPSPTLRQYLETLKTERSADSETPPSPPFADEDRDRDDRSESDGDADQAMAEFQPPAFVPPEGHRATVRRRTRRRKVRFPWGILVGLLLFLAIAGGVGWRLWNQPIAGPDVPDGDVIIKKTEGKTKKAPEDLPGKRDPSPKRGSGEDADGAQGVAADDGTSLWADPAPGEPVSLALMPPGSQLFLVVRPSDLDGLEESFGFMKSLGPAARRYRQSFEQIAHAKWSEVEQLLVGFYRQEDDSIAPTIVIHFKEALGDAQLLARFGNPTPVPHEGQQYYKIDGGVLWIPAGREGKSIIIGPENEIKEAIQFGGEAPVLLRPLTDLLRTSNVHHQVTLIGTPGFLLDTCLREGGSFYFGDPRELRDWLRWLLGDEAQAFLFSVELGDPVYSELRLYVGSAPDARTLADAFRGRVGQFADLVEEKVSRTQIADYWKRVALRYPQMLRFVDQHVRFAVDKRQLVFNVVLPRSAPSNLLVGAEMLLVGGRGSTAPATAGQPSKAKTPKTIEQLVDSKMSMMFDQMPLDLSLQDLESIVRDEHPDLSFPFAIRILGGDLQLEGITQNQQIVGFKQQDTTLGEILTAIVMKANPITTVKKPTEEDQKLVWVIGPDPEDKAKKIILITTRKAAKQKKFTLPKVFQNES